MCLLPVWFSSSEDVRRMFFLEETVEEVSKIVLPHLLAALAKNEYLCTRKKK